MVALSMAVAFTTQRCIRTSWLKRKETIYFWLAHSTYRVETSCLVIWQLAGQLFYKTLEVTVPALITVLEPFHTLPLRFQ